MKYHIVILLLILSSLDGYAQSSSDSLQASSNVSQNLTFDEYLGGTHMLSLPLLYGYIKNPTKKALTIYGTHSLFLTYVFTKSAIKKHASPVQVAISSFSGAAIGSYLSYQIVVHRSSLRRLEFEAAVWAYPFAVIGVLTLPGFCSALATMPFDNESKTSPNSSKSVLVIPYSNFDKKSFSTGIMLKF